MHRARTRGQAERRALAVGRAARSARAARRVPRPLVARRRARHRHGRGRCGTHARGGRRRAAPPQAGCTHACARVGRGWRARGRLQRGRVRELPRPAVRARGGDARGDAGADRHARRWAAVRDGCAGRWGRARHLYEPRDRHPLCRREGGRGRYWGRPAGRGPRAARALLRGAWALVRPAGFPRHAGG
ncbi:hypothetical protein T492DRAFT_1043232 [Pavlovales sp. CCMP2436]|nr:hypothetical protein T492DRAFT_1043232 [Pavlovales sp. CCMP2436]